MRKPVVAFALIVLVVLAQLIATSPMRKSLRRQLNPNYVRAMAAYRKLERKIPHEELRAITVIGILNGAQQTEAQMEQHLVDVIKDLVAMSQSNESAAHLKAKIAEIEQQLRRDQSAMDILTASMDMAMNKKNSTEFQRELQKILQNANKALSFVEEASQVDANEIGRKVASLRQSIVEQVNGMRTRLEHKIENTLDHLIGEADDNGLLAKASNKVLRKRAVEREPETPAVVKSIKSIWSQQDFRDNLIDGGVDVRRAALNDDDFDDVDELSLDVNSKSSSTTTTAVTTTTKATKGNQEFGDSMESTSDDGDEGGGGGGGGGLVGLIGSLSGGEGGSDVGALIGALTGLISTLFGPGGLDIESLIGTASSLISGLLSGNKNFGTVLGAYVGTLFDGISGGGGAINNGQFFGNLLGTVYASLSADPEDDDLPARPLLFAQNLISSFMEAKNRKASDEEVSEERKDNKNGNNGHTDMNKDKEGGSDSGAFIKHIVSHLVSSAVSLILNASLGASGGASHASHSLFAHSSAHKSGGGGAGAAKY